MPAIFFRRNQGIEHRFGKIDARARSYGATDQNAAHCASMRDGFDKQLDQAVGKKYMFARCERGKQLQVAHGQVISIFAAASDITLLAFRDEHYALLLHEFEAAAR